MKETGVDQVKDTAQPGHRSRRPPRPLTHNMDLSKHYYDAGLRREGTGTQTRSRRRDKKNEPRQRNAARPQRRDQKENRIMGPLTPGQEPQNTPSTKPSVGGTQTPSMSSVIDNGVVSGMDCAKIGGTAFITGLALMGASRLFTRWLG